MHFCYQINPMGLCIFLYDLAADMSTNEEVNQVENLSFKKPTSRFWIFFS